VNGWELSSITTLASAEPVWATVNVSGQQFTGITTLYTSSMNGSGGWNRVPFWPVNSLDIDRIYRVDARLSRGIPIGERMKASLMFEGFKRIQHAVQHGREPTGLRGEQRGFDADHRAGAWATNPRDSRTAPTHGAAKWR